MQTTKTVVFWLVIMASAFLLWQVVRTGASTPPDPEISYSSFLSRIAKGEVRKVSIAGNVVRGHDDQSENFRVIAPPNQSAMLDALQQHEVEIWFKETPEPTWGTWLMNLAPLILLGALWFFMIRTDAQSRQAWLCGTGTFRVWILAITATPAFARDFCHLFPLPHFPPKRSRMRNRALPNPNFCLRHLIGSSWSAFPDG